MSYSDEQMQMLKNLMPQLIQSGAENGYIYHIKQMPTGIINGYVHVTSKSKFFGVHYNQLQHLNVHGGLTYSELEESSSGAEWVLGFDTAHLISRNMYIGERGEPIPQVQTQNLVWNEIKKLTLQMREEEIADEQQN
ncbi:hypothetical protein EQG49_12710 [Periweissella cryptocerci]|uniref:Uncharacterized protein n=1 Tax=Periweissella cryptocerci TaxID=2506420 RepID=A0A4P6YWI0_9LACO|nr:hypothetical protein [Periweissella cryptocerci]QBO37259.1 hypothetical protein EQG49_12710 [Periweissella cryptocerci]